mgnify:CR=1 FL=1
MRYGILIFVTLFTAACGGSMNQTSSASLSSLETAKLAPHAMTTTSNVAESTPGDETTTPAEEPLTENPPAAAEPPAPTPATASIATSEDRSVEPLAAAEYDVSMVWAVEIATRFENLTAGNHALEMQIVSPKGRVYELYNHDFEVAEGATSADVWHTLMVSGTAISDYNMVGKWTVRAYLDGASEAITTGSFDIK